MLINLMTPLGIREAPVHVHQDRRDYRFVVERGAPETPQLFLVTFSVEYVRGAIGASWLGFANIRLLAPHVDRALAQKWLERVEVLLEIGESIDIGGRPLHSRHHWKQALLRHLRDQFLGEVDYMPPERASLARMVEVLLWHYKTMGELPLPLPPSKKPSSPWCRS